MGAKWGFALLLFALGNAAHAQSADLRIVSSASPSTNLVVGQEITVTTTIINDGPDDSQIVQALWLAPVFQPFVLEDPQPITEGCNFETLDVEPPLFNFSFNFPTLAAGEQRTCVARVRVRVIPSDYRLLVAADANRGLTPDPNLANNSVQYQLIFANPTPFTIPTMTVGGLVVLIAGALSLGFIQRAGVRR